MTEIKTDYRFIKFRKCVIMDDIDYTCFAKNGDIIGSVAYNRKWRKYEYLPMPQTAYTHECCKDIAHFLSQLESEESDIKDKAP